MMENQNNKPAKRRLRINFRNRLAQKILIPVILVLLVAVALLVAFFVANATQISLTSEDQNYREAYSTALALLDSLEQQALGLALSIANNPIAQEALANQDRDALIAAFYPIYEELNAQFDIPQAQFHIAPATSFLRLHDLEKWGDDLSSFRTTVLETNATGAQTSGIEVGRGGPGIRGVVPVIYQGRQVGSFEIGLNIDVTTLNQLQALNGGNWHIILNPNVASLATLGGFTIETPGPIADTLSYASTDEIFVLRDPAIYQEVLQDGQTVISRVDDQNIPYGVITAPLYDYKGAIIGAIQVEFDRSIVVAQIGQATAQIVTVGVILSAIGLTFLLIFIQRMLVPVSNLTRNVELVAQGNYNVQVPTTTQDELGVLAHGFNEMATRLRDSFSTMESTIAARTHDLSTTVEVSQLATSIYEEHELTPRLVEFIRAQFGLYYTQIYLVDEGQRYAILRHGSGSVGKELLSRNHKLDLAQTSIVARVVQTNQPVLVANTATSDIHKPNPLLPNTRSEAALPLAVAGEIFGVLDMQAERAGTFNPENLPVFQAMANQVASALRGAQAFDRAQDAIERAEAINRRLTSDTWNSYLGKAANQGRVGYEYNLEAPQPLTQPLAHQPGKVVEKNRTVQPIILRGQQIGTLVVQDDDDWHEWRPDELTLIEGVASRVAQSLEQFRAFDETHLALEATEVLYRASGQVNRAATMGDILQTLVDLTAIGTYDRANFILFDRPWRDEKPNIGTVTAAWEKDGHSSPSPIGTTYPIADFPILARMNHGEPVVIHDYEASPLRDENLSQLLEHLQVRGIMLIPLVAGNDWVGFLSAQSEEPYSLTTDQTQQVTSISIQAASVIQNIRLLEQAEKRAAELETVANVSAAATTLLDVNDLLQTVSDLTKTNFGFYHAHMYLLSPDGQNLALAAGAGEVGRVMKQRGHSIPLDKEESLVATSGRTMQGVIVNDVTQNPAHLANPLLPETRSELAVPMVVGEQLIGVLDIQDNSINRFTDQDVRILTTLADQVAVAVQNARAFAEVQRRAKEMAVVSEVSAQATNLLDPAAMVRSVADLTASGFNLYHLHIYLTDPTGQYLEVAAGTGAVPCKWVGTDHRVMLTDEDNPVVRAVKERHSIVINQVHLDVDYTPNPSLPDTRSQLVVPIIAGGQVIGVLEVFDNREVGFTEQDVLIQSTLADQIAVAVENARAFQRVQQARQETERVYNTSVDMLGSANFDGYFTTLNPAWSRTVGYTTAELLAAPLLSLVHPDDVSATQTSLDSLLQGAAALSFENRYRGKDGGYRWLSWNAASDIEAGLIHFVARDVTTQKAQEENLRKLSRAVEQSPDVVVITDTKGTIEYVNPAFTEITGYTPEEAIGGNPRLLQSGETPPEQYQALWRTILAGQEWHDEIMNKRKDGTFYWASLSIVPVVDADGEITHYLASQQDITGRRLAEEERQMLYTISRRLSDTRTPADLLEAVLVYGRKLNVTDSWLIFVETTPDNTPVYAEFAATWRPDPAAPGPQTGMRLYLPEFPFARMWMEDPINPLLVSDVMTDDRVDEITRERVFIGFNARSRATLPLYTQGRWIGLYVFSWDQPHDFTESEQRIFNAILSQATSAVDAVRAAEETRKAREEAEALYRVSALINEVQDEHGIVAAIAHYAVPPQVNRVAIMLNNDFQNPTQSTVVADWSREDELSMIGVVSNSSDFAFASQSADGDIFSSDDIREDDQVDEEARTALDAFSMIGLMYIPLTVGDNTLGSILLSTDQAYHFVDRDRRVLGAIGEQASVAIERMILTKQTRRRALEMETVANVSAAAATMLDADILLQSVVDLAKQSFDLYHAHIYLMNEERQKLVLAAGAGEAGRLMKERGHSIPVSREISLVATVARTRKGVMVNDIMQSDVHFPNPLLPETRSELAVPMIVGDTLIGVLDVQSRQANRFTAEDVRIQTALADQIAVAVQNARAYQRQLETAERLREVDRLKSQFLANMSHELRTPLNSIIGYSEVLLDGIDGDLSEDAIEDVEAIHSGGRHLLTMINEILDLAKIEAGQMKLERRPTYLAEIVADALQTSQILIKDKPVTLNVLDNPDMPLVYGDPVRIRQVILNLLSNAAKFTEQGSITLSYGLEDAQTAFIRVTDTGIGMSAEGMAVIFQRFEQVDGSSTRRAGGTGLGLNITRHLVQMHEGEIYVESEVGQGSSFWFTLPVYVTEESPTLEAK